MIAEHPTSEAVRTIIGPFSWLWCLLFGPFYFAVKGMWGRAVISLCTLNGLLVIMPIMNRSLVRKHYENMGWKIRSL